MHSMPRRIVAEGVHLHDPVSMASTGSAILSPTQRESERRRTDFHDQGESSIKRGVSLLNVSNHTVARDTPCSER